SSGALGRGIVYSHYSGLGYKISMFELGEPINADLFPYIPDRFSGAIRTATFPVFLIWGDNPPLPLYKKYKTEPNQTPEPTPTAVTPDADASVVPSAGAAHL